MAPHPTAGGLSPEEKKHRAAYWETLNHTLAEHAATAGNLHSLDETSESAIWATTGRAIESADPPEALDFNLHSTWLTIFVAAQHYDWDNPKHDTLLRHILYLRAIGTLHKLPRTDEGPMVARTSNGQRIWTDLPFLVEDFYQAWSTNFLTMSPTQRRNISSFVARLVSVGVCDGTLTGCLLMAFREALETPRRWSATDGGGDVPVEDLLPALRAWMSYASHQAFLLVQQSFNGFPDASVSVLGELAQRADVSAPGLSLPRWTFWKERLAEMKELGGETGARRVWQMMEDVQIDLEGRWGEVNDPPL